METLFALTPLAALCAPITLGLVQVVKQIGLPSKWAPVASILIGVGLISLTGIVWQAALVQGIIVGLAASGLWSGTKTTVEAVKE